MTVTIKIKNKPFSKINQAKKNALLKTAIWVLSEIRQSAKVPKETGALEDSGFVQQVSHILVYIIFDTPYARRWYFNAENVEFHKTYNVNAQDHFADDFIFGSRRKEIIEVYGEFYKKEAGNLLK